jgi:hypothetical protein
VDYLDSTVVDGCDAAYRSLTKRPDAALRAAAVGFAPDVTLTVVDGCDAAYRGDTNRPVLALW